MADRYFRVDGMNSGGDTIQYIVRTEGLLNNDCAFFDGDGRVTVATYFHGVFINVGTEWLPIDFPVVFAEEEFVDMIEVRLEDKGSSLPPGFAWGWSNDDEMEF